MVLVSLFCLCTFSPFSHGVLEDTLDAYLQKYTSLVPYLADNPTSSTPASDAEPAEQTSKAISLRTGVVFDGTPIGKKFGAVKTDVAASYSVGDTVQVAFIGANPRVRDLVYC